MINDLWVLVAGTVMRPTSPSINGCNVVAGLGSYFVADIKPAACRRYDTTPHTPNMLKNFTFISMCFCGGGLEPPITLAMLFYLPLRGDSLYTTTSLNYTTYTHRNKRTFFKI